MKKKDSLILYKKYHIDRDDERLGLFLEIAKKFNIRNVLYPGSFVHITPSFIFPRVVYVDSYKKAKKFFEDLSVYDYICKNKFLWAYAHSIYYFRLCLPAFSGAPPSTSLRM